MIREATKYDKEHVIELMLEFLAEAKFPELEHIDNVPYWNRLLDNLIAGQGIIFLAEGKGVLMAAVLPSIWCDKTFALHELGWYVRPDFRNGTTGYRLLDAYMAYGRKLKLQGRIKYFSMTKMDTSPNLDYERFGFRKKDENWIQ